MEKQCSELILEYLKEHGESAGGTLELAIGSSTGYKPSTVARAARLLAKHGKIVRGIIKNERGPNYVIYNLDG